MESDFATATGEKQAPVQLSIWDLFEPDPAPDAHTTDLAPAGTAVSIEQQSAAVRVIAPADESPTPVSSTVGTDDGPLGTGMASDAVAAEPGQPEAGQTKSDSRPTGKPIPIQTGREAMKRRAVRLYSTIAALNGLTTLDLLVEGKPLVADIKCARDLRPIYMAVDEEYRKETEASRAGEPVDNPLEHRRAWDRARQEINRAFDDLVRIYAAEEVVDQDTGIRTGYQVYRLPEVRRRQIEHGAVSALKRPGGGLVIVDHAGDNAGRQGPVHSRPVQQTESQVPEVVAERNDNAQDDPKLRSENTDPGPTNGSGERRRNAA